ncbi:MAG: GNAT family N-acetyltransferase, partial [Pseudoxanthomonas sp.]
MPEALAYTLRAIEPGDDAAVAAIIRKVMPEFGAVGCGFAINDPEVDWMSRAYARPRS